jgi:hypothetical protein
MVDAILTDNDRKAELSFAYLAALAAKAGYTCQRGPRPDMDSIDATIRSGDSARTQFDVQLKATSTPKRHEDGLHFRLSRKNYNDLTTSRMTPLILLVLELPADEAKWVECTTKRLTMRRCGWWAELSGCEATDARSKTIVVPTAQRLGQAGIAPLMARLKGEKP